MGCENGLIACRSEWKGCRGQIHVAGLAGHIAAGSALLGPHMSRVNDLHLPDSQPRGLAKPRPEVIAIRLQMRRGLQANE
jgi:hypothetical protein